MILICLLAAVALEFHFKWGSEFRQFGWFITMREYAADLFNGKAYFDGWFGIAVILLVPIAVLFGILNIFDGIIFWLLSFVISAALLFYSLGPAPLEKSFGCYFESMERGDLEAAYLHLNDPQETGELRDIPENDELVRFATRKILVESQKRYFGVIAWFVLIGPLAALLYRLAHVYKEHCSKEEFNDHLPLMEQVVHWIDWIPARLTSMLFLLTGDFANGFYRIQDYLLDAEADNEQLISETGIAALGLEMGVCDGLVDENNKTIEMIRRAVIFYLVVGAIFTISF